MLTGTDAALSGACLLPLHAGSLAAASPPSSCGSALYVETHVFFLPPFFPFEIRLFLPTAMAPAIKQHEKAGPKEW